MISVIVCTHGNSALELVKSVEMICGKQDGCEVVPFLMGEALEDLEKDLSKEIEAVNGKVICLTDLVGGTPFNTLVGLSRKYPEVEIITGVNIPMLLQLFVYRTQLEGKELINSLVETGRKAIVRYEKSEEKEEDF